MRVSVLRAGFVSVRRQTCAVKPCRATKPNATVYSGPSAKPGDNDAPVTLRVLRRKYAAGEKITMVTAYDYPSAAHVDQAGIDILLIGDSAAMVIHGYDNTLPITVDHMLVHCAAVARGASRPFLVADLPFGSYEVSSQQAVETAMRFLKFGQVDAVKLEGGSPHRVAAAEAIVRAGIACMGHVGLTPQSVSAIGGFRPQAQQADAATQMLESAKALEQAGCFAVLMECVPAPVAAAVTQELSVPTIGIGAGPMCSGQVLVFHDLLGMMSHPHHTQVTPKFCKQFGKVGHAIHDALCAFKADVKQQSFPDQQFSPYKMKHEELQQFTNKLKLQDLESAADAAHDTYSWLVNQKDTEQ